MNCPHCGKRISPSQVASSLGSTTSEAKALSSADNGANWQKPHFRKVEHFLSLGLFPEIRPNEWKVKIKLRGGSTYNPDFYDPKTECYIEVATSKPNISSQRAKWREAMRKVKLRVFWWEGEELTGKLGGRPRLGEPTKE